MAVYTGVILGGGDTPDNYYPCKVILVQHEGVWVILFMLSIASLELRDRELVADRDAVKRQGTP